MVFVWGLAIPEGNFEESFGRRRRSFKREAFSMSRSSISSTAGIGTSESPGCVIEKRLANDDLWMKCGETKTKYERGKATGVEVGQTYVFRVRAENAGGVGPPGPESDNLKCKYKALKPRIDRKSLREITIRVGESLSFDVDILGEPAPDTTWTKQSSQITA